jgi:UDP-2,3-diacylglucosamine hydrolase
VAPKLGILAGSGDLPARLIDAARAAGRDVFVIAFEGDTPVELANTVPHAWVRLGAVSAVVKALHGAEVEEVVLAGGMRRPPLSALKPDWRGIKMLKRLGRAAAKGDGALLQVVVDELESEGFRVVGADDILIDLLAPAGVLGAVEPDEGGWADITVAVAAARAIGAMDVGQAAVAQQGVVLGVEAKEGTDELIARCAGLREQGPGGVLAKVKKPDQERRVDLPTIGVNTVEAVRKAGLGGIAVEAGQSLIIDRLAVIRAADEAGLFVVGVGESGTPD